MMTKTLKNALIAACFLATSQAMDITPEMTTQKIHYLKQANLEDAYKAAQDLIINKRVPGKKILVISDLDGTLTDQGHPSILNAVKPRGCAHDFVSFCFANEINTVISSAWDVFAETLYRANQLGLSKVLMTTDANPIYQALSEMISRSIGQAHQEIENFKKGQHTAEEINYFINDKLKNAEKELKTNFTNTKIKETFKGHLGVNKTFYNPNDFFDSIKINYCHLGNVISIRDTDHDNFTPQYYRNKALAPLIVYPNLDYSEIDHVIFVDDSSENVKVFLNDMKRLQEMKIMPFKDTMEMKIFELSGAYGQSDLK